MIITRNFAPFVNELLVKEEKDGIRFMVIKAPFLVDQINSDFIRELKCMNVKVINWEEFKDFSIISSSKEWVKKDEKVTCNQRKETRDVLQYSGKSYMNYLGAGKSEKYADAENQMSDEQIVSLAINFYEE